MRLVERAAGAVWEFVVGDDWRLAVGVAVAIGVAALLQAAGVAAWWLEPLAVLALLAGSLRRAAGAARRGRGGGSGSGTHTGTPNGTA